MYCYLKSILNAYGALYSQCVLCVSFLTANTRFHAFGILLCLSSWLFRETKNHVLTFRKSTLNAYKLFTCTAQRMLLLVLFHRKDMKPGNRGEYLQRNVCLIKMKSCTPERLFSSAMSPWFLQRVASFCTAGALVCIFWRLPSVSFLTGSFLF